MSSKIRDASIPREYDRKVIVLTLADKNSPVDWTGITVAFVYERKVACIYGFNERSFTAEFSQISPCQRCGPARAILFRRRESRTIRPSVRET